MKRSEPSLFAPLSPSAITGLQQVYALVSEGFQRAADSFYVLQWFYASLLHTTRRHYLRSMWHSSTCVAALAHSANRLFAATGRLAYGASFAHSVDTEVLIRVVRSDDVVQNERLNVRGPVHLHHKLSADAEHFEHTNKFSTEQFQRARCNRPKLLSAADLQIVCERLAIRSDSRNIRKGQLRPFFQSHSERHTGKLHKRMDEFLEALTFCRRQFEETVGQLQALGIY